jgi:hypothetical protein
MQKPNILALATIAAFTVAFSVAAFAGEVLGDEAGGPVDMRHAPDNARTPGIANPKVNQENIQQTICKPGWVESNRPRERYINTLKRRQLRAWKYAVRDSTKYEEDHRIPIEVGGHPRDGKNLWPQPYGIAWNARVKNKLELYIQAEVCAGNIKLIDGQAAFQRDWVDLFRLYCGPEPGAACNPPGTPGVQIEVPEQ